MSERLSLRGLHAGTVGPIDLDLPAGECVALFGPSGTGKTLLLRAIADLDPQQGELRLDGVEHLAMSGPEWRRQVAYLPAESGWWADRVSDHFGAVEATALDRLGFQAATLDWAVARLSSGERQRLAILRLLANRPAVLLLDEPTANLDPQSAQRVEALIAEYLAESGAAVLWVSHDPAQRERVASRQLRLEHGRLEEAGAATP